MRLNQIIAAIVFLVAGATFILPRLSLPPQTGNDFQRGKAGTDFLQKNGTPPAEVSPEFLGKLGKKEKAKKNKIQDLKGIATLANPIGKKGKKPAKSFDVDSHGFLKGADGRLQAWKLNFGEKGTTFAIPDMLETVSINAISGKAFAWSAMSIPSKKNEGKKIRIRGKIYFDLEVEFPKHPAKPAKIGKAEKLKKLFKNFLEIRKKSAEFQKALEKAFGLDPVTGTLRSGVQNTKPEPTPILDPSK